VGLEDHLKKDIAKLLLKKRIQRKNWDFGSGSFEAELNNS